MKEKGSEIPFLCRLLVVWIKIERGGSTLTFFWLIPFLDFMRSCFDFIKFYTLLTRYISISLGILLLFVVEGIEVGFKESAKFG